VKNTFRALGFIAVLIGTCPSLVAQDPAPATAKPEAATPAAASPAARGATTPLRVVLTVSRYQGDKKISSLPYSLSVSIGGPPVRFRMGADLPYSTVSTADGAKPQTQSYAYRTVGVGIDVTNQVMVEPGAYRMDINVTDSSVAMSNQIQGSPAVAGVPMFRNFSTNGSVLLKDGQTSQLTTAADPITGEIMRVDVTLSVVK
jgi:Bacterial type II and III secretion system protein